METDGKTAQNTGDTQSPSLIETAFLSLGLVLFSRQALYNLLFKKYHTFNLITIALLTYLLPYRVPLTDEMKFFHFENLLEGMLLSFFFLCFLWLFGNRRGDSFMPLLRILLAMEITALAAPLSYFFSGVFLQIFMGVFIGWYLSVGVFAFSHLFGQSYYRASLCVLLAFFLTQLVPSFFVI